VGREKEASPYRPGGFILHPVFLAVMLVGVAVWLGLFFVGESSHGVVGVVVAVLLVVLGLPLGLFLVWMVFFEALGMTIWSMDRDEEKRRRHPRGHRPSKGASGLYIYLLFGVPPFLITLVLGFAFGYQAGGVFWGVYMAVASTAFVAYAEYLVWRRNRDT
jgi:hypothetical protein